MRERFIAGLTGRLTACASLAALIFFTRAWLVRDWGSPLPIWDQWGTEAVQLYRPWLDGTLRWNYFFYPQNEHRMALTKVADLALFMATARWNIWWELLLNAALHAATAFALAFLFYPSLNRISRTLLVFGLAILFAAPSGWQNALWGFQSQVYLCSLLSLLALSGLLISAPFHGRWWMGWAAALLALFTQASGIFVSLIGLLIGAFGPFITGVFFSGAHNSSAPLITMRRIDWRSGLGLLAVLALVALGWVLWVDAPQHASMHAHSLIQFYAVFSRCLAWPWVNSGWLWPVTQAPFFWFAGQMVFRRSLPNPTERLAVALALLAGLHAAAVAYSRGAGLLDERPLSRYQDPLLLGVAANLYFLLRLVPRHRFGPMAAVFWSGIMLAGLITLTTVNLSLNLPYKRDQDATSLLLVREYIATHDATVFTRDPLYPGPHPDSSVVRRVLDDPILRPVLPAEILDSSARAPWLIEISPWLALISAAALLLITVPWCRPVKPSLPPGE